MGTAISTGANKTRGGLDDILGALALSEPAGNPIDSLRAIPGAGYAPAPAQPNVVPFKAPEPKAQEPAAQKAPAQEPEAAAQPEEKQGPSQEDFDHLMALVTSQRATPATPAEVPVPTIPTPAAPSQEMFKIQVPQVKAPELTDEAFSKITGSKEEFTKYIQSVMEHTAAATTERLSAAIPAAASMAARGEISQRTTVQAWAAKHPEFESLPADVLVAAVNDARTAFPNAPIESVLFYAARNLKGKIAQANLIDQPRNDKGQFAPSASRQGRASAGEPELPQAAKDFNAMVAQRNVGETSFLDANGGLR